jgi:hypothetical protein
VPWIGASQIGHGGATGVVAADSRWRSAFSDQGNGSGARSAPVIAGETASSSRFTSWRVTYARMIPGRNSPFLDGILLICHDLRLVTLLDVSERILDSRNFLPGEVFNTGGSVLIGMFSIRILAGAWLMWENIIDVGASYSSSPCQQHQKIPCAW